MSWYTFIGALEQGFVFGLMSLGVYLTFRVLDFPDLSVDGTLPLGAAVSAAIIVGGGDPYVSLLAAFAAVVLFNYRFMKGREEYQGNSPLQVLLPVIFYLASYALVALVVAPYMGAGITEAPYYAAVAVLFLAAIVQFFLCYSRVVDLIIFLVLKVSMK